MTNKESTPENMAKYEANAALLNLGIALSNPHLTNNALNVCNLWLASIKSALEGRITKGKPTKLPHEIVRNCIENICANLIGLAEFAYPQDARMIMQIYHCLQMNLPELDENEKSSAKSVNGGNRQSNWRVWKR